MIYHFGESVPESQTNLVLSTRYFVREVRRYIRSVSSQRLLPAAGSTGRRNTVHPYRQGFEAYGLPATWLSDDPKLCKHE
jgi:hypothetical protein